VSWQIIIGILDDSIDRRLVKKGFGIFANLLVGLSGAIRGG
tara:strand:- start:2465 stop:2587 length:123 start_codon:yes stop_codon:yes gene_type:complete